MRNKKNYPSNWNDEIRPLALKRGNYKCSKCKIRHRAIGYYDYKNVFVDCDDFMLRHAQQLSFKLVTIILQVHHKDGNPGNNLDDNLQCLCNKCHLEVERNLNILKRKMRGIIYPKN